MGLETESDHSVNDLVDGACVMSVTPKLGGTIPTSCDTHGRAITHLRPLGPPGRRPAASSAWFCCVSFCHLNAAIAAQHVSEVCEPSWGHQPEGGCGDSTLQLASDVLGRHGA